jgi:hypothetical protein
MALSRIFFRREAQWLVGGLLSGRIRVATSKALSMEKRLRLRKPAEAAVEFLPYGRSIRTGLVDAGQVSKLKGFFRVATIKRWGRKRRKAKYLAAEILPNPGKMKKGCW